MIAKHKYWGCLIFSALLIGSATPDGAFAADKMSEAEYNQMVEMAKKEGRVSWYSTRSPVATQAVAEVFQKKYPEIQVDIQRLPGFGLWERINAEAAAGRHIADVFTQADYGIALEAIKQKLITSFVPPEAQSYKPEFLFPGGYGYSSTITPVAIAYNTDMVAKEDVPQKWADLLDPKWAGKKIGTGDPRKSGQYTTAFWQMAQSPDIGESFFEKLAAQDPVLFEESGGQINSLSLGEYPLMIILEYRGWEFVAKGAPVAVSYPSEGMGWGTDYTHLMTTAPNPNAGRLFMDFFASREGTDALARALGFYTVRDDVGVYPEGLGRPPLADLKLLPVDAEKQVAETEEFKRWYGKLFD